jgi:hypothetical protein
VGLETAQQDTGRTTGHEEDADEVVCTAKFNAKAKRLTVDVPRPHSGVSAFSSSKSDSSTIYASLPAVSEEDEDSSSSSSFYASPDATGRWRTRPQPPLEIKPSSDADPWSP